VLAVRSGEYLVNLDAMLFASETEPGEDSSSVEIFFTNTSLVLDDMTLAELSRHMTGMMLVTMNPGESQEDFLNRLTTEQGGV
jgi:hypothetical protein